MNTVVKLCRLCLRASNSDYKLIEEVREVLSNIQLNLDLTITEEAVICKDCEKNLWHILNFKSTCTYAEDFIASFASTRSDSVLDLRDVCPSQNKDIETVRGMDYDVCRLCVQCVKTDCCKSLDIVKESMALTETVLSKCLPEINLMSTKQPVVCISCIGNLDRYLKFMKSCWDVEEKIKEFCKAGGTTSKGEIQLIDMLKNIGGIKIEDPFESRNVEDAEIKVKYAVKLEKELLSDNDMKPTQASVIKIEDPFEKKENEDVKLKEEYVAKLDEQEINIKDEEAKITEDGYSFDSFHGREGLASKIDCTSDQNQALGVTVHQCDECIFTAKRKCKLKVHMLKHKSSSEVTMYKCQDCTYETKYRHHLQNHTLKHKDSSEVTMHKCDMCTYTTKYKYSLKVHTLSHKDSSEVTMYKCEECNFSTKFQPNLKTHTLKHRNSSEVRMHKCEKCNHETKNKYSLKVHMLTHKSSSEAVMYKCDKCTYKTKYKHHLRNHSLMHKDASELTVYKCEECTFETKFRAYLKTHILTHKDSTDVTMYKCEECAYQSKFKPSLKKHMKRHMDLLEVSVYQCEKCTFKTNYKSSLKVHMLTHKDASEVTMYVCEECTYETKYKYCIKSHMRTHSS